MHAVQIAGSTLNCDFQYDLTNGALHGSIFIMVSCTCFELHDFHYDVRDLALLTSGPSEA